MGLDMYLICNDRDPAEIVNVCAAERHPRAPRPAPASGQGAAARLDKAGWETRLFYRASW